jgi:hypothetical protein
VWLTDCKGGQNPNVAEAPPDAAVTPKQVTPKQPAPKRPAPRARDNRGFLPALR